MASKSIRPTRPTDLFAIVSLQTRHSLPGITMRLKADLTLLLVSIIWGSAFVAQRVAGQMGSVYLFNGARYLLAALVVLPFAVRASRVSSPGEKLPRGQYKWMLVAGLFLFLGSALQQAGMGDTNAGNP